MLVSSRRTPLLVLAVLLALAFSAGAAAEADAKFSLDGRAIKIRKDLFPLPTAYVELSSRGAKKVQKYIDENSATKGAVQSVASAVCLPLAALTGPFAGVVTLGCAGAVQLIINRQFDVIKKAANRNGCVRLRLRPKLAPPGQFPFSLKLSGYGPAGRSGCKALW